MSSPFDGGRDPEEFSVVSHQSRPVDNEVPLAQPDLSQEDESQPSAKSAKTRINEIDISERRVALSKLVDDEVSHLEKFHFSFHFFIRVLTN